MPVCSFNPSSDREGCTAQPEFVFQLSAIGGGSQISDMAVEGVVEL